MEKLLQDDLWFIVYSVAYGGVIGLFYDVLRILRIAVNPGVVLTFIQDILFWFFSAIATFIYIFVFAGGTVRIVFLVFVAIGWIIYYISFGRLITWLANKAFYPIKMLSNKLKGFVAKLFKPITEKINGKSIIIRKKIKKSIKNSNFLFHFNKKNNKIYKDKYSYAQRRRR